MKKPPKPSAAHFGSWGDVPPPASQGAAKPPPLGDQPRQYSRLTSAGKDHHCNELAASLPGFADTPSPKRYHVEPQQPPWPNGPWSLAGDAPVDF